MSEAGSPDRARPPQGQNCQEPIALKAGGKFSSPGGTSQGFRNLSLARIPQVPTTQIMG